METPTFTCATCDATVVERPVFHLGLAFCCAGCAADGPCMCSYDAADTVADGPGTAAAPIPSIAPAAYPHARPDADRVAALTRAEERVLVAVEA